MIKEMIIMYAPAIFCLFGSAVAYYKNYKQLKQNAQTIIDSKQYKKLTKEMEQLRNQLSCENQYLNGLIEQNKTIIEQNERIMEKNEKNDEKVQENLQDVYNS